MSDQHSQTPRTEMLRSTISQQCERDHRLKDDGRKNGPLHTFKSVRERPDIDSKASEADVHLKNYVRAIKQSQTSNTTKRVLSTTDSVGWRERSMLSTLSDQCVTDQHSKDAANNNACSAPCCPAAVRVMMPSPHATEHQNLFVKNQTEFDVKQLVTNFCF